MKTIFHWCNIEISTHLRHYSLLRHQHFTLAPFILAQIGKSSNVFSNFLSWRKITSSLPWYDIRSLPNETLAQSLFLVHFLLAHVRPPSCEYNQIFFLLVNSVCLSSNPHVKPQLKHSPYTHKSLVCMFLFSSFITLVVKIYIYFCLLTLINVHDQNFTLVHLL